VAVAVVRRHRLTLSEVARSEAEAVAVMVARTMQRLQTSRALLAGSHRPTQPVAVARRAPTGRARRRAAQALPVTQHVAVAVAVAVEPQSLRRLLAQRVALAASTVAVAVAVAAA